MEPPTYNRLINGYHTRSGSRDRMIQRAFRREGWNLKGGVKRHPVDSGY
jgi:hypothetical protein